MYHRPSIFCVIPLLLSCNNQVTIGGSATKGFVIDRVSPLAAKPGESVTIHGSSFAEKKSYLVSASNTDSKSVKANVNVADSSTGNFIVPDGLGNGVKTFNLSDGTNNVAEEPV